MRVDFWAHVMRPGLSSVRQRRLHSKISMKEALM